MGKKRLVWIPVAWKVLVHGQGETVAVVGQQCLQKVGLGRKAAAERGAEVPCCDREQSGVACRLR